MLEAIIECRSQRNFDTCVYAIAPEGRRSATNWGKDVIITLRWNRPCAGQKVALDAAISAYAKRFAEGVQDQEFGI